MSLHTDRVHDSGHEYQGGLIDAILIIQTIGIVAIGTGGGLTVDIHIDLITQEDISTHRMTGTVIHAQSRIPGGLPTIRSIAEVEILGLMDLHGVIFHLAVTRRIIGGNPALRTVSETGIRHTDRRVSGDRDGYPILPVG